MRWIEYLVAGRLGDRSHWSHVSVTDAGILSIRYPIDEQGVTDAKPCELCRRTGLGDLIV
jgi:hypothetical protein